MDKVLVLFAWVLWFHPSMMEVNAISFELPLALVCLGYSKQSTDLTVELLSNTEMKTVW